MNQFGTDRKETMKLTTWLKERELNCRRLAAGKTGADRAGWLDDAQHFLEALAAVEERDQLRRAAGQSQRSAFDTLPDDYECPH